MYRRALDFPRDNASRSLMHEQWPRALDHELDNALHDVRAIMRHKKSDDPLA
jgi:hypothetical protein